MSFDHDPTRNAGRHEMDSDTSGDELARLGQAGRAAVPPIDQAYADRLEADLRVRHAQLDTGRRAGWGVSLPQVLAGLALMVVAVVGVVGLTGRSTQDAGISVDVQSQPDGGDPEVPSPGEPDGSDGSSAALALTPTPDAASVPNPSAEPTVVLTPDAPAVEATSGSTEPPVGESATVDPSAGEPTSVIPTPTTPQGEAPPLTSPAPTSGAPEPTPTVAATRAPTAVEATPVPTTPPRPTATPTATPLPTVVEATAVPLPSATPVPPTPSPTSTPVAPPIVATCESRIAGDAIGVVCEWEPIVSVDLSGFRVMRTRNGGPREIVAELGPGETIAVDRQVRAGDSITYRVLGLSGDVVRTESAAVVVEVPS